MELIDRNFGTSRGLIRLGVAHAEVALGAASIVKPTPNEVKRLVFVCHGNICRSAFADVVAKKLGIKTASFGLSTSTGKTAHPPAIEIGAQMGHDLSDHRTTRVEDFVGEPGDFLLGMETRHLRKLSQNAALSTYPRSLLGLWSEPRMPHLHDPYTLSPEYFSICLERIETAVSRLASAFPQARVDQ
jgi:protein-tyrosine phosphatase